MKYEIPFSAVIVVEAPNVVKAKEAASRCKLIGEAVGYKATPKERFWRYQVDIEQQQLGAPKRKP